MSDLTQDTQMNFSATAEPVLREMRKIIAQQKQAEDAMLATAKAAEKGATAAADALKNQGDAVKKLRAETEKLRESHEKVHEGWGKLGHLLSGAALVHGIKKLVEVQDEWVKKLVETNLEYDKISRKVMLQAVMSEPEFKRTFTEKLGPAAVKIGMERDVALEVAKQMMAYGVSPKEALGGETFKEIAGGVTAMGTNDAPEAAAAVISFMRGRDIKVTPENTRALLEKFSAMKEQSKFNSADIIEMAQIGAVTKSAGISDEEFLAAFVTLKHEGELPGSEVGTSLKNILVKMIAPEETDKKLLDQIGGPGASKKITPRGAGGFGQALQNLADITNRLPDEDTKLAFLGRMFGERQIKGASTLLANLHSTEEHVGFEGHLKQMAAGREILAKNIQTATSGPVATKARIEGQKFIDTQQQRDFETNWELFMQAQDAASVKSGESAPRRWIEDKARRTWATTLWALDPTKLFRSPTGASEYFGQNEKEIFEQFTQASPLSELPGAPGYQAPKPLASQALPKFAPGFDPLSVNVAGEQRAREAQERLKSVQLEREVVEAQRTKREAEFKESGGRVDERERKLLDREFGATIGKLDATIAELNVTLKTIQLENDRAEVRRNAQN